MQRHIALRRVAVLLLSIGLLTTISCEKRTAQPLNDLVRSYVYGYTSGVISKASSIQVRFAQPAAESGEIGAPLKSSPLSFSPSIKGKAHWEDEFTLVFQPEEYLPSNERYIATVSLGSIFKGLPKEARSFEFDFETREMFFEVNVEMMQAVDPAKLDKQELIGFIRTSDVANPEPVEKLLSAKQNGKALPITWEHNAEEMRHQFVVGDIARTEKDGEMSLSWNGKALDVDYKGDKTIEVPSLSNFKVMDVKVYHSPQQYIAVNFSDPLLAGQNLTGLVAISGYGGQLNTTIDGNRLLIYPSSRLGGEQTLNIQAGVRNILDRRMPNPVVWNLAFEQSKPAVRLVGNGVIMPNSNGLVFPFEAINLTAVDVEIFQIFHNNVLQFLQTNELDGYGELERVGRIAIQKKIDLKGLNPVSNAAEWTRYALDLSELIKKDPQSIYQVRIAFRREYSSFQCESTQAVQVSGENGDDDYYYYEDDYNPYGEVEEIKSIMGGWYGRDGYYRGYNWEHRENPCFPAFYNYENFARRNVIASDLGIIAKTGKDGSALFVVTDLRTARPVSSATIEIYDFQQQKIQQANTNDQGIAETKIEGRAFVVVAKKGEQSGYLKLRDGQALSLSRFDVSGAVTQKGLKGMIYGERGVWRPGDSLFLHFILEDKTEQLPEGYPISFELFNPKGQLFEKRTTSANEGGIYPLFVRTTPDVPTGNWIAKVKAGGATFDKVLKIETIKPNRLKVVLDFGKEVLRAPDGPIAGKIQSNWLHGAPAQNLRAVVEAQLVSTPTSFSSSPGFTFDDPARRSFQQDPMVVFDQRLLGDGSSNFRADLLGNAQAPGKMMARFKARVFEEGGDFSSGNLSLPFHPYNAYVGVRVEEGKKGYYQYEVKDDVPLVFTLVDTEGKPLSNKNLSVGLYRVDWRWWWSDYSDYHGEYSSSDHYNAIQKTDLTTNAKGQASWKVKPEEWGRYMVRVCDLSGGHCSGTYFYAGYPWYDEDGGGMPQEAAMLTFTTDKEKYMVNETVTLRVPASADSRVLITLETGSKVIQTRWEQAKAGENVFTFKTTPEMTPTVYAHVSLIQPHNQLNNDLPIRMYGVTPIQVEDPKTRLQPQIAMPKTLEPEKSFTLEVSEEKGQAMAYTVAIVDDGLLDLTNFKTPNPWDVFYAREALGVKTFDMYDFVLGAYGGSLERLLSVGGDGAELASPAADQAAQRFKPVVMHAGPFYLQRGRTAKHTFTMPNYVGSVRAMVVAVKDGAYGNAEKTVTVKKPLMLLATLPRVLSPGESLRLPVNVFAMEDGISQVTVSVEETSGLVKWGGGKSQTVNFSNKGEKMAYFDLSVGEKVGKAKFTVKATSGKHQASHQIELQVRNPNPYVTRIEQGMAEAGKEWSLSFQPVGMEGTNSSVLEVSTLPPINLEGHLRYLIQYPYGCLEQTLSGGFPQLYVDRLLKTDDEQKKKVAKNVQAAIDRLRTFQTAEGGFAYWPGDRHVNHWSNTYAGHFLLEAQALGYSVPAGMIERWTSYQKKLAKTWDPKQNQDGFYANHSNELSQAYRLYALALAKDPDMGAMNRLRESANLHPTAKWRLAAAYALAGQKDVATKLLSGLGTEVPDYRELAGSYGSPVRDKAMILETLVQLERKDEAAKLVRALAQDVGKSSWYSTQEIGYTLLSIGKYARAYPPASGIRFQYQQNGGTLADAGAQTPVMQIALSPKGGSIKLKNSSDGLLYIRVISTGQPLAGQEASTAENLQMKVNYLTTEGQPLDVSRLKQGSDFIAEVTVTHPNFPFTYTYNEMALHQVFPSGWEIINTRMDDLERLNNQSRPDFQDVRDDRVYTFFDLRPGTTQVFRIRLNAAYQGRYYLPAAVCSAMYSDQITASQAGRWVEVSL